MRELLRNPWVRLLILIGSLLLLLRALYLLRDPLTPFAVAFALAYFLNPVVNALERSFARGALAKRLRPRTAAVAVLSFVVLMAFVAAVLVVVPAVYDQVTETVAKLPAYFKVLRAKVEPAYQRLNLRYPEQTEEARRRIEAAVRDNLPGIMAPVTRLVRAAFSSLLDFVLTVLNLVIIPVFAVYLLFDMNRIRDGSKDLVPHRYRPYVYSRLTEVDRLLSAFARGQITVSLILGAFYAVGLTLCGVPMGLLLGFVIGFFNLIPFMSYVLGLPLALLLSWLDDQSPARLLAVAGIFTFGQFVEGNFITPRIVGGSLGLHAVVIMLAVLLGGSLFGFPGMLLALPTTAALSVFWADLRRLYFGSAFFRGGASEGSPFSLPTPASSGSTPPSAGDPPPAPPEAPSSGGSGRG